MNFLNSFKDEITKYLTKSKSQGANMVKFEVTGSGDFSFLTNLNVWSNYLQLEESVDVFDNSILAYACESNDEQKGIVDLKNLSEKLTFQIQKIEIQNMKCFVHLMRETTFKTVLRAALSSKDYGKMKKSGDSIAVNVLEIENSSITNFRLQTISSTLKNLISNYSTYNLVDNDSAADCKLLLATRSNLKKDDELLKTNVLVLCSVVCDEHTKKISHITTADYMKKRISDMHLIAVHKYGLRSTIDGFVKNIERLGKSACKLDMVEVKASNTLTLTYDPNKAFVLYNSARIETLLENFEEKLQSGYYPPQPEFDEIDLKMLANDEEWLLLKQIMLFPDIIENSIVDIKSGKISVHLLYKYLQNLAATVSNFYCKKKVLTENRPHLMPVLHSKILLLKAVQAIFNKTLGIFDIEPISFM